MWWFLLFSVCLFVVAFIYMDQEYVTPQTLFGVTAVLTLIGYFINAAVDNKSCQKEQKNRTS